MVEGRARDERDDGRRGPAAARVPAASATPKRPSAPPAGSAPSSATTGRGRNFYGGPGDLSTTIEAYVALRLAGDEPEAEHMRAAAEHVRSLGRAREGTGVHAHLAGAVRRVAVGARARAAARDDAAPLLGSRSTPTTSRAGPARRSSRCRWCSRSSRSVPCRSGSTSCPARTVVAASGEVAARAAAAGPRPVPPRVRAAPTAARRASRRWRAPSAGSSTARRPTARGAGSSRRGSTR